jgi:DNA-binding response OmpR family regulator
MKEDRIAGFNAGADIYLNKPVDFEELASVVCRLAKRVVNAPPIVKKHMETQFGMFSNHVT